MASTPIKGLRNQAAISIDLLNATSAASALTTIYDAQHGFAQFDALTLYMAIQGATGGTLDVYVQNSWDGVAWYDYWHPTQIAAGGAAVKWKWSPTLDGVVYTGFGVGTLASSGVAVAAGSTVGGHWGDWLRVVIVSGASTSAGATQLVRALGVKRSMEK